MLDVDLAALYGVETRVLLQAVRRNSTRFPADFMFQLTDQEVANLRSQSVTSSSRRHGGRRNRPYAFTEQGVAMLSSVLPREPFDVHHEAESTIVAAKRSSAAVGSAQRPVCTGEV